jgi:hypothetical protein
MLRAITGLLLVAACAVACAQVPAASRVFALRNLGRATVPLDGAWRFHTGDDPAWAAPGFDDSGWQAIDVGRAWEGQGHPYYTGFGWYRLHLDIPANGAADWQLALLSPYVQDACEVYWNGELVGRVGKLPPDPTWYPHQRPAVIPLGALRSGVLAIRVWKAPYVFLSFPDEGGLVSVPQAGSREGVNALVDRAAYENLRSQLFELSVQLFSGLVGLLALLGWLRNRKVRMLGWLALAMVFPIYRILVFEFPQWDTFNVLYGLIGPMVAINNIATWFLLLYLLRLDGNKGLFRWTQIFSATTLCCGLVNTVMVCLDWTRLFPRFFLIADVVSTIPIELLELFGVVIVLFAVRKRLDAARWILAVSAVLSDLYQGADDITGMGVRWTHWTVEAKISAPLFSIGGNVFALPGLIGILLLVSILYVAWRFLVEQSQRQRGLEQEYRSAQELQQVLIPKELPTMPRYAVTSAYRPAQEVGGDFFQLMPLSGDGALLVIGDVSGKGLPAAMAVALLVGAIRSTAETTSDPAVVLSALNRMLHGRLRGGFATCQVLRMDGNGNCLIANAGHLPPFLNADEVALLPALPLGLAGEVDYELTELRIGAGEQLTLYTDGLLEARNGAGELFGFERIAEMLAQPRDAQQVADAAQAFGQEDDITVLTLTLAAG